MFRILIQILFAHRYVSFETPFSLAVAVSTLRDGVSPDSPRSTIGNAVVGNVAEHRVVLRYRKSLVPRNAVAPFFVGQFKALEQGSELRGVFRSGLGVRVILASALGFLALWIAATIVHSLYGQAPLWFPLVGAGALFFLAGLSAVGRKLGEGDEVIISHAIATALKSDASPGARQAELVADR